MNSMLYIIHIRRFYIDNSGMHSVRIFTVESLGNSHISVKMAPHSERIGEMNVDFWISQESRKDYCKKIEDEIARHRVEIARLSRRLNDANSPIMRLPDELLVDIFSRYVSACAILSGGRTCSEHYRWTRVSRVCHRWRAVALASPTLWSNIILHNKWHETLLARSLGVPLDLCGSMAINRSKAEDNEIWMSLHEHGTRVRSLQLYVASSFHGWAGSTPSQRLSPIQLRPTFSHLQKLSLTREYTKDCDTTLSNIFSQLFHDCPVLEELATARLPFTDIEPFFTRPLRVVSLIEFGKLCRWHDFLAGLGQLQYLHTLKLRAGFTAMSWFTSVHSGQHSLTTIHAISLPSLQVLDIEQEDAANIGILLSALSFPSEASLRITLSGYAWGTSSDPGFLRGERAEQLQMLAQGLASWLSGNTSIGQPSPILDLCLGVDAKDILFVAGWTSAKTSEYFAATPHNHISSHDTLPPAFHISGRWSPQSSNAASDMLSYLRQFGVLENLRTLALRGNRNPGDYGINSPKIHGLLSAQGRALDLTHLSAVRIFGDPIIDFLKFIDVSPMSSTCFVRSLKFLHITSCDFWTPRSEPSRTDGESLPRFTLVREILARRTASGCILEKLAITDCSGIGQSEVDDLRNIVDVEWEAL